MLLTELPSYMSGVLGFDLKSNALLSALPFLVMWVYSILFGSLMDYLGTRGLISRTGTTKLATAIGRTATPRVPRPSAGCVLVRTSVMIFKLAAKLKTAGE